MDDLTRCPFCGGKPVFVGEAGGGYRVRCTGCSAQTGWGDYGYQVADKWNKRFPGAGAEPAKQHERQWIGPGHLEETGYTK